MNYKGVDIILCAVLVIGIVSLVFKLSKMNAVMTFNIKEFEKEKNVFLKERNFLNTIIENANILVCVWDINGDLIRFNSHAQKVTGYTEEEVLGANLSDTVIFEAANSELKLAINRLKNGEVGIRFKSIVSCKNGNSVDIEFNCSIMHDVDYIPNSIITIGYDISEKKQAQQKLNASFMELEATQEELIATEQELAERFDELKEQQQTLSISEERYRLATEGANDGLWDWDMLNDKFFLSEKGADILGYKSHELGENLYGLLELIHNEDRSILKGQFNEHITGNENFLEAEIRVKTKTSEYKWILVRGKAVFNEEKIAIRIAGSNTDITERKEVEAKVNYMAYNDTLTGLPNRTYSEKHLNELLETTRDEKDKIGILTLDLDNFKNINDTIGHTFGNKLLIRVANILKKISIQPEGMFARIGGDEFQFILTKIKNEDTLRVLAENIIDALKNSIIIGEHEINITSSIGITIFPKDGTDSVTLFKNADTAMYSAKSVGKNNYQFFVKAMNIKMLEKSKLEKNLRCAIKNNEFVVFYQPQINISTGEVVGMEALVRWNSPTLGLVSPMDFIPVAEETGLIIPIGEFVLRTACQQNKEWQDKGYEPKRVAVNLSGRQFQQKNLMEIIEVILEETKLEPEWLELEITESIAMQDLDYTIVVLKKLIARGIHISLDDFGTGFSSLNYLKILPINILKIDKSFVDDIEKSSKEAAIARAIISMAHSMALVIVAEGVEHIAQLEFLKDQGCEKAQGYLFSKPVTVLDFEEILKGNLLVDKY